jgi:hypothetical protein
VSLWNALKLARSFRLYLLPQKLLMSQKKECARLYERGPRPMVGTIDVCNRHVRNPAPRNKTKQNRGKNTQEDEGAGMGPSFFCPYATFGCRVARRPRLRGAGTGVIGSGAGGSRSGSGVVGSIASLPIALCIAVSDWRRNSQSTTSELFPPHANAQRSAAAIAASKFGELTAKFEELTAKFGELAAPGNSSARNPAHGCCQVKRSQSAATITQAMNVPTKRAVDSIAGAQSALSAALKVVIVLGGGGDHPGPLRVLAGWW